MPPPHLIMTWVFYEAEATVYACFQLHSLPIFCQNQTLYLSSSIYIKTYLSFTYFTTSSRIPSTICHQGIFMYMRFYSLFKTSLYHFIKHTLMSHNNTHYIQIFMSTVININQEMYRHSNPIQHYTYSVSDWYSNYSQLFWYLPSS